jgi:hypothetical protein
MEQAVSSWQSLRFWDCTRRQQLPETKTRWTKHGLKAVAFRMNSTFPDPCSTGDTGMALLLMSTATRRSPSWFALQADLPRGTRCSPTARRELVPLLALQAVAWLTVLVAAFRRYTANKLASKLTIQAIETRAWAVPTLDMLPQVCKGAHVFHCWLGCAQVIEIHEVHGWLGQLTDRMSRIHVRHIPATSRIDAYDSTCTCMRLAT